MISKSGLYCVHLTETDLAANNDRMTNRFGAAASSQGCRLHPESNEIIFFNQFLSSIIWHLELYYCTAINFKTHKLCTINRVESSFLSISHFQLCKSSIAIKNQQTSVLHRVMMRYNCKQAAMNELHRGLTCRSQIRSR